MPRTGQVWQLEPNILEPDYLSDPQSAFDQLREQTRNHLLKKSARISGSDFFSLQCVGGDGHLATTKRNPQGGIRHYLVFTTRNEPRHQIRLTLASLTTSSVFKRRM